MRYSLLLTLLTMLIVMVACGDDPETIKVYITTTPDSTINLVASNNTDIEAEALAALSGTSTSLAASLSATDTPQPTATQTGAPPTVTSTSTPEPTVVAQSNPTETPTVETTEEVSLFELAPDADELPVLQRSRMGIQIHPDIEEATWNLYLGEGQRLGFDWIKIQIPWKELEPQPGQFNEKFTIYVSRVVSAHVNGFNTLISVVDAPDWARPSGARLEFQGPPADPNQLANFITTFLNATDAADNRVSAVEVWNEPNLRDREWDGVQMDGGTYFQYLIASYNAIKAVSPNTTVVTAGLAPVGDLDGTVSDRRFLQQMYDAGLAQYPDIRVGVHPYGWANAPDERCCIPDRAWANNPVFFYQDTLYDYIEIMQQNGHQSKLWSTEFGWGTYDAIGVDGEDVRPVPEEAPWFEFVTTEQQAEYTMRAFEIAQQAPLIDWVEVSILWNLNFAAIPNAVDNRLEQAGYSVLDAGTGLRFIYFYLIKSQRVP